MEPGLDWRGLREVDGDWRVVGKCGWMRAMCSK